MTARQGWAPLGAGVILGPRWPGARAALAVVIAACSGPDSDTATEADEPAGGVITLWTDSTELFMEHPALIVGQAEKFAVHLTDLTDFAPLRSGRVTMRFVPRGGGTPLVVVQETPRAPGIYGPAPEFTAAGTYDLTILVDSDQTKDSITVPGLVVYASAEEAPRDDGVTESGISFLKEQQWKSPGFRTEFAVTGQVTASFGAPGTIEAAAGRYAEVAAPTGGLVSADGLAGAPVQGAPVRRGQVLAWLAPSLGEGGAATYAEARARLREAEDEQARARRLVEAEAAPARRLLEAEIRLETAREALRGLGEMAADGRVAVRSPIDGIVVQRRLAPGARVDAGAVLFTVIDPSVVWLVANVAATDAALVSARAGGEFLVEGDTRWRDAGAVVSVSAMIDPATRTLPVVFEAANAGGQVKIGSLARVRVRTGLRESGVTIPASAVLEEDGRPVAFVQVRGETFEKRPLQLGTQEGGRVLVLAGVRAGERVVTGAAYQVRLASLSTSVPAHGHEH